MDTHAQNQGTRCEALGLRPLAHWAGELADILRLDWNDAAPRLPGDAYETAGELALHLAHVRPRALAS